MIAERLGIQHESFLKTTRKHRERIEQRFGHLRFEIKTVIPAQNDRIRERLIGQTPRTVLGDYVPKESLDEAYKLLLNGDRQKLIGE